MHTEGMGDDPMNHTKWKHTWKWHIRASVWDKIATDWAGDDDWISKKNKTSSTDKTYEYVNCPQEKLKEKGRETKQTQNRQGNKGPLLLPFTHAKMAKQSNCVATLRWLASGKDGKNSLGQKYQEQIGMIQKTLHQWWKKKIANFISNICEYVKHIFREHNQEADHWANVGPEGQKKAVIDKKSNADTWKAVERFWDGSCKDNGENGCGVVIKRSRQRKMGHDQQNCSSS